MKFSTNDTIMQNNNTEIGLTEKELQRKKILKIIHRNLKKSNQEKKRNISDQETIRIRE